MKKIEKLKNKIDICIQELGGPGSGRKPGDGAGSGSGDSGGSKGGGSTDKEVVDAIAKQRDSRTREANKLKSSNEITQGLNQIEKNAKNGGPLGPVDRVYADKEAIDDFVKKQESSLSDKHKKTSETLAQNRSGSEDYIKEKYGEDWKGKEVYKRDIIRTTPSGDKAYIKDVPFVKNGGKWVQVDARDISGARYSGHDDFTKYQWSVGEKKGYGSYVYSHAAADAIENRGR